MRYITKSHYNEIYLKERLFRFKIDILKGLEDNLDEFDKIIQESANIGEKIAHEIQVVILSNSLSNSYQELKLAFNMIEKHLFLIWF